MQALQKTNTKQIIANNINYLLSTCNISRKDFSKEMDIKYTTICDWVNAKSYPRIDTLERIADYFSLEIQDFFIDIQSTTRLTKHIEAYAERMSHMKNYENTYPDGFFQLFGCISDDSFDTPDDLPIDEIEVF